MSVDDTLCFANFDGVTGPPTVDGYTGIHDDFVITSEFDAGYVEGCRLTYGSGTAFPPVIFNGVKNGNFLNFAFFCRLDYTFDAEDVLVIALRPQVSNPDQTTARRIDIFPVYEAVGADEDNGLGGPAGTPDDNPPGVPVGVNYHIRTNHTPQNIVHYRGQAAGDPWTTLNPDTSTYAPTNISVKTRSWLPPTPTQTTSVGAQVLPTGTFNVVDTTAFAAAGVFLVSGQLVNYTGKTGTSFTGCTGGVGAIAAGTGVAIPEVAWSIEVQVPLTNAVGGGGANWINIQDSFGLYYTLIRVGKTPASGGTGSQGFYSTQFLFPANTGNFLTGILDETTVINPAWYGTGLIPALQSPPGSNLGQGVHFVNFAATSVGSRDTTAGAFSPIGGLIRTAAVAGADNRLVAQVETNGPTANNVRAEFRFANWGLPPATFPSWDKANGATEDQAAGVTVPAGGGDVEITWTWPKASVPAAYAPPHQHQCVWVQLNAAGVNFNQSSIRRNMDFDHLSEKEEPATISGVGYPVPASGKHDFLLMTFVRVFDFPVVDSDLTHLQPTFATRQAAGAGRGSVIYLWIVHGYRRTGKTITINKREFEVLDDSPGSFGTITDHRPEQEGNDFFFHELTGGGIKHIGGPYHAIKVPHNGKVEVTTRIAAGPAGSFKPRPESTPEPECKGCLAALLCFLKKLFGK